MKYFRMLGSILMAYVGYWITDKNIQLIFNDSLPNSIDISGFFNILAGYGCLLVFGYLTLYWLKNYFHVAIWIGDFNKVVVFIALVLAPLLAIITNEKIHSNIEGQGYIECTEMSKISTRYSSNTYTKNPQICEQIVKEKYQRD